MRKLKITLLFAMAVLLCAAGSALAGTATLSPIEDSYVWDDDLDGNYGAQNYMIVGEWDGASPYGTCRSYLMFDLSSIPAGQTITSATLHLSCKTLYNSNAVTGAHFLSDDTWDEYTITWRNVTTAFNAVATDTTSIAVGDNTWNVLSDVSIEYAGDKVYSVVMKLPNEGVNADGAWLHSKEYSVASDRPSLVVDYQDGPVEPDKDYGDAPEGVIAYPSLGVTGNFPTCITVGPAAYVEHGLCWAHFEMIPPPGFDFETDGNGGLCPGYAPYDNDECFMDGDAGLMFPDPYTIQAGTVVNCPAGSGTPLGQTGTTAVWGANADIMIINNMPVDGFVNVLMDWDQNGAWGVVNEHVLVNWPVPAGFAGPLSALGPPPFTIGPNSGHVWTRFMISEAQVAVGWDGSGIFEDGETEDYLLRIDPVQQDLDYGDAPDSAAAPGYPTLSGNSGANHTIDLTKPWLGTLGDAPDAEPDGQPDATATGDDNDGNDDEDGVAFFPMTPGTNSMPIVEVHDPSGTGGGAIVEIWVDFNINQTWEASELAFSGLLGHGTSPVTIFVPNGAATGTTFARCRISTAGTGSPTGNAPDGEVEDYEVIIEEEPQPETFEFEFSLDIGSDTELSDPFMDGDEVFDPGDIYWWHGPLLTAPTDGFKDDASIFTFNPSTPDPWPDPNPPIPWVWQQTVVPIFDPAYTFENYHEWFDLDGHDQLENSLVDLDLLGTQVPTQPIAQYSDACIHDPEYLAISYDDDMAPGWASPAADVPVTASSPAGLIYGMTGANDEIIGVTVTPGVVPPVPIVNIYPVADEKNVHQNMAPNPDAGDIDDDDVDSLDVVPDEQSCPVLLFSPDHEATYMDATGFPLDPGGIYERYMGTPVKVVDPVLHLGIIVPGVDIDALEFVWLEEPDVPGSIALALLFSVDEDDPLTPVDESGGLLPMVIYYSFMTGWHAPYVDSPDLFDDIDALTNGTTEFGCMKATHPDYATWVAYGKPDCWCYRKQCKGDIDGEAQFGGAVDVYTNDTDILIPAFGAGVVTTVPGVCADVDHGTQFGGAVNVYTNDLNILLPNFGAGVLSDCDMTHFNFWITP